MCRAFYDREPAITIRKYAFYLVAEVTIEGKENMRDALSDGFRQVWLDRLCTLMSLDLHTWSHVA